MLRAPLSSSVTQADVLFSASLRHSSDCLKVQSRPSKTRSLVKTEVAGLGTRVCLEYLQSAVRGAVS